MAIDGVAAAQDGTFGDGIDVFGGGSVTRTMNITRSSVFRAARAGIANFASVVSLLDSRIGCNGIDVNGESTDAVAHKLDVLRRHCEALGTDYDAIEKRRKKCRSARARAAASHGDRGFAAVVAPMHSARAAGYAPLDEGSDSSDGDDELMGPGGAAAAAAAAEAWAAGALTLRRSSLTRLDFKHGKVSDRVARALCAALKRHGESLTDLDLRGLRPA